MIGLPSPMLVRNLLPLRSVFGAVLGALRGFLVKRAVSVLGSAAGASPEGGRQLN